MRPAGIAAIALTLVLGACAVALERPEEGSSMSHEVPAGAIQEGDDYYMVPVGTDAGGCVQYSPWSGSNPVTAAIYYRKADGSFTLSKEQAGCDSG